MFPRLNLERLETVGASFHDDLNRRLSVLESQWNPDDDESKAATIRWVRLFVLRDSIRNLDRVFDANQKLHVPTHDHDRAFVESIFPEIVAAAMDYAGAQNAMIQITDRIVGCSERVRICEKGEFQPLVAVDELKSAINAAINQMNAAIVRIERTAEPNEFNAAKTFVLANIRNIRTIQDDDPIVSRILPIANEYDNLVFMVERLVTEMGCKSGRCATCFVQIGLEQQFLRCKKCNLRVWCSPACGRNDQDHACA